MHACSMHAAYMLNACKHFCMHACRHAEKIACIGACMHYYLMHESCLHACMRVVCMHARMIHACKSYWYTKIIVSPYCKQKQKIYNLVIYNVESYVKAHILIEKFNTKILLFNPLSNTIHVQYIFSLQNPPLSLHCLTLVVLKKIY